MVSQLFEVSWEICNKVGGIYTVVKSKAKNIVDRFKDNYYVVGPYIPKNALGEFEEKVPKDSLKRAFDKLKNEGIICHYGKWLIDGEPNAILIDFSGFAGNANAIKGELWEKFRIDSLGTQFFDYDQPIVWSYAAGKLIEALAGKGTVAQFHEWLAGGGLLYLKSRNAEVATVFTTHATILGRTLASSNIDLYGVLKKINPEEEARKFGIQAKFLTEKACAMNADAFTTVSEITGIEAEHLLGRKPDILLPNGLDSGSFPTFEEASVKHQLLRRKIREFIMSYFFPYYSFDIEHTLVYFIAGRYEFHDKGIDIFIKALSRLNAQLKRDKSDRTVVAFIWVPAGVKSIKQSLLESKTFFQDIQDVLHDDEQDIHSRLIYCVAARKSCSTDYLLGKDLSAEIKRKLLRFKTKGIPPIATHDIDHEESDAILNSAISEGLLNRQEDRVKIIFYPTYLTGADRLLNLSYYEAMQGSHLGVFPSYYEPWGYTPLEAAALGVSSLTTDLAGFGRYLETQGLKEDIPGIFVIKRFNRKDEDVVDDLSKAMVKFAEFSKEDRIKNKIEAKRLASSADWKNFVENYIKAYNMAVVKRWN
jgi:glycogen synthase